MAWTQDEGRDALTKLFGVQKALTEVAVAADSFARGTGSASTAAGKVKAFRDASDAWFAEFLTDLID